MTMKTVNVLNIVSPGSGYFGGIEAYLMNYYKNMNHKRVHFDFAFCGTNTMKLHMDDAAFEGCTFTEFKSISGEKNGPRNWLHLIRAIRNNVGSNYYDIVEVHTASPLVQAISGIALHGVGIEKKIVHPHAMQEPTKSKLVLLVTRVCKWVVSHTFDLFFSCSYAAGEMYGEKITRSKKFRKIPNAIDFNIFSYNESVRAGIRKKYSIDDNCFVVGHVARLSEEKNQIFLIKIFEHLLRSKPNSLLWIVGEGSARNEIEKYVKEKGLQNKVVLFGQRSDVQELLQAMDIFVMTSYFEGLCISAIESQVAGLPTVVSTGIPEECKITERFIRVPLEVGAEKWVEEIEKSGSCCQDRQRTQIYDNCYDIKIAAKNLEDIYCFRGCFG